VHTEKLVILDFGSQFTKLIARRIREQSVYSEILPHDTSLEVLAAPEVKGIILSGGPQSVYGSDAPSIDPAILRLEKPILGICYGFQLLAHLLGGQVVSSPDREYGPATIQVEAREHPLFRGLAKAEQVWMSHGDRVAHLPAGFQLAASSANAPITAMVHPQRPLAGIQFHPEVAHTEKGSQLLRNFIFDICACRASWKMVDYLDSAVQAIRRQVGDGRVVLGLSGGVDSAVAALLLHRACGDALTCVFVDHGMMRKDEKHQVLSTFAQGFGIRLLARDAGELFLARLQGVADPERKRKIIGHTFIEVFEEQAAGLGARFLGQGTLYPDVIESALHKGPAQTIKSHHNVGGLPERMNLQLVEPLRELFKDEVRQMGRLLGLPEDLVNRHPFPGPGLAVRILGPIDASSIAMLQEADEIFIEMLRSNDLYEQVAQAFVVLLPVYSVGIMGDGRTYEKVCALRAVTSSDFMTADWARLPHEFLAQVSARIVNEVKGINRVVFDITSKPPGTIEWE
jgi:GMP synthase (glutamine-hydrolysing)